MAFYDGFLSRFFNTAHKPLTAECLETLEQPQVSKRFFAAIRKDRAEEVSLVLGKYPDAITWTTSSGMTSAAFALNVQALACTATLLDGGADKNQPMQPGSRERLINRAITDAPRGDTEKNIKMLQLLIARDVDITSPADCLAWTGDSRRGSYRTSFAKNITPLEQAQRLSAYKHLIENTKKDRAVYAQVSEIIETALAQQAAKPAAATPKKQARIAL